MGAELNEVLLGPSIFNKDSLKFWAPNKNFQRCLLGSLLPQSNKESGLSF